MRHPAKWLAAILFVAVFAHGAFAQEVVEDTGKAKINWTTKEMVFTGSGAVNLKASNAASARIGAERAAELAALRNALESLKGVKIKAGLSVGDRMKADPAISAEVEGVVRGFIVAETRYYSDGGVQRDLRIPLDGDLSKAILKTELPPPPAEKPAASAAPAPAPAAPAPAPAAAPASAPAQPAPKAEQAVAVEEKPTGLVVVAQGFKVIPVLAPKIVDEDGKDVYDVTMVTDSTLDNGIVSYVTNSDVAQKDKKVTDKPLVVKAIKSPNSVDLVISKTDAEKVRQVAKANPILSQGRVIIVKD